MGTEAGDTGIVVLEHEMYVVGIDTGYRYMQVYSEQI